jgi:hypothetical protein
MEIEEGGGGDTNRCLAFGTIATFIQGKVFGLKANIAEQVCDASQLVGDGARPQTFSRPLKAVSLSCRGLGESREEEAWAWLGRGGRKDGASVNAEPASPTKNIRAGYRRPLTTTQHYEKEQGAADSLRQEIMLLGFCLYTLNDSLGVSLWPITMHGRIGGLFLSLGRQILKSFVYYIW